MIIHLLSKKDMGRSPVAFLIGCCLSVSIPSIAQTQSSTHPQLETQLVTAQKREESLQDVPISVIAIDGSKLADSGIETLEELTAYMPNIHFTETGFSTQVRIRGIGSDNSQGFEQSVGMYVDGIYFGRSQLFRKPMMDMERIEVLRGPQSTLFGKNSIAGALNLSTAKPENELEGSVSISSEFEYGEDEFNGMLNIPLTDTFAARFAVRERTEDGYYRNTYKNKDEPKIDESALRLSFEWQASDALTFNLKAEQNEYSTKGRPVKITQDNPVPATSPNGTPWPFAGLNYGQILQGFFAQPELTSGENFDRQYDYDERSDSEVKHLVFSADYAFSDYTLTLISGYLDMEYDELCDCDNTASEILELDLGEDYDQFSQEIRIASNADGSFEWLAGAFYQTWDQTFYDRLNINPSNFLASVASTLPGNEALALFADTGLTRNFEQSSDSWAVFGQSTWAINDQFRLTLGARYTEEDKDAHKVLDLFVPSTDEALVNPQIGLVYYGVFQAENEQATITFVPDGEGGVIAVPLSYSGHNISADRSESAFTPLVNVEFDFNEDVMLYATYTTGFKAGGFDPRSNSVGNLTGSPQATENNPTRFFEFEEEKATAYELGLKTSFADGRAELNVALYRTDYEDLQISQFDGAVGFNPSNAKETRVQGLEIDGRWAVSNDLTASWGLSWLDFEYLDFENGNCYQGQSTGGTEDFDGDGVFELCSYTGKRGVYTPDYTLNVGLDYLKAINSDLTFRAFIDAQHVDGHNVHVNLDPLGEIDAHTLVSARLGIEGDHWSIALLGKNLLDEYIISYSANAPLSGSTFGTNTFYSVIRKPRTVALEMALWF